MKTFFLFVAFSTSFNVLFSQKVGIGITSPLFKLDVRDGSINVDSVYRIGTNTFLSGQGTGNLFVGKNAGKNSTGSNNTFIGDLSGISNIDGHSNCFFGKDAGAANYFGSSNAFFGRYSGFSNTEGHDNSFFGRASGFLNTLGTSNSFFGVSCGFINSTGSENSFFGQGAGGGNTEGDYNSCFGRGAGFSNSTGTRNTSLGYIANFNTGTLSNATSIGANARVDCSNCLVLGSVPGINAALSGVNVGIGTTMPLAKLHVADSSVLFSATADIPAIQNPPPVEESGRRMMWYPDKAAFRVGYIGNDQWNQELIGNYSFAAGNTSNAFGNSSIALGKFSYANGIASLAVGNEVGALGDYSIAMGNESVALSQSAVAIGEFATASGYGSVAIGNGSFASGGLSTAMGTGIASGVNSIALGYATLAANESSVALGYFTHASASFSTAMGNQTTAKSGYETVIGSFNTNYTPLSINGWNPADRLFVIGNGTGPGVSSSNAMTVLKNGKIGIGIATPLTNFHIFSGPSGNITPYSPLVVEGDNNTYINILSPNSNETGVLFGKQDNAASGAIVYNNVGNFNGFQFRVDGNTTQMEIYANGDAWLGGILSQASDIRLKKNIKPLENSLQKILQVNGYNYLWKNENHNNGLQTGVLAQEVQKLFPELVKEDNEGILSVNYSGLIPVLIESIKEQQKQNDMQQEQIDELKKLVLELMNREP